MKTKYGILLKLAIIVSVQLLPFFVKGQVTVFQQIYQSNGNVEQSGRDALPTSDGGYMLIGMTGTVPDPWDTSIYIMKTNSIGDTLWTKRYGGFSPDYPYSITETYDGNFFVVGFTASFGAGSYDTWLLKINPNGDTLWTKTFGGPLDDQGKEIIKTSDGNYVIVGRSQLSGNNYDSYLMKINSNGNVLWTKYYGGSAYETGRSVKQTNDGGYILIGYTMSYGVNGDIYLIKTNAAGDTTWTKTYGGILMDDGNSVVANADGSYTFTAETESFGAGDMDVQVTKVTGSGVLVWNKFYGGNKKDISKTICKTSDGGYMVGCISRSFGWINPQMWLLKLDAGGDTTWTRNYGSWDHEHCHAARQTPDGGYISVGHTKSYGPNKKIMFLKLDINGTFVSAPEYAADNTFQLYPNPSTGFFEIGNLKSEEGSIEVFSALGQKIYSENFKHPTSKFKLDLSDKPKGIYFIKVLADGEEKTRRIIIR